MPKKRFSKKKVSRKQSSKKRRGNKNNRRKTRKNIGGAISGPCTDEDQKKMNSCRDRQTKVCIDRNPEPSFEICMKKARTTCYYGNNSKCKWELN